MAELNVITWLWGQKYGPQDVARLAKAVKRNFACEHRFHVFADPIYLFPAGIEVHAIEDRELIGRNCFCRLRVFDPEWQERNGLHGKIISLDLDLIIVSQIDDLFAGDSSFKILQNVNTVNPNPFNASVMMLRAGEHADVWSDFSLEAVNKTAFHEFPDDQGWIWHKLPNADGWKAGKESGIYGFQKKGWPGGFYSTELPKDARIVSFIGKRKPQGYSGVPWVRKFWTEAA